MGARLHPAHVGAGSLCVGLAAANIFRSTSLRLAAAAAAVLLLCLAAERPLRLGLLALGFVLAGCWWGSVRLAALDHSVLASRIGTSEPALVEVTTPPRPGSFDVRARAKVLRYGSLRPNENVLLELPRGRLPPQGSILSTIALVQAPPGPEHGFDERTWLQHQGIQVVVRADGFRIVGRRRGLGGVADRLHAWLAGDSVVGLKGQRRAALNAIVLGESQGIDPGLLADYRASGLYHVLAVDGLKVTAVAGGAGGLAFLLGVGRALAELVALAAVAGYVLAVGAHPSVIRAAVAAALISLAWLTARQRDRWQALLVAAAALLVWNPYFLYDAGFQLSFAAVSSIFIVTPRVVRVLEGYPVPRRLAQLIAVSTACGLATAPVTWLQFHQVSLVTVPANVVGVPLIAEMLGLALLTAAVAPVAEPVARAMADVNGWGAAALNGWARLSGGVPFAQVTSGRSLALLLATCVLLFALWKNRELLAVGAALTLVVVLLRPGAGTQLSPGRASWTATPGALNPAVSQQNIRETICKSGWTSTVRPPTSYTNALKARQMRVYRRRGGLSDYQEDHLISLELGGDPTDPRNLWPEPYPRAGDVDGIENQLNAQVCSGELTLAEAQRRESILKHTAG
jgi:competence protein ComEC